MARPLRIEYEYHIISRGNRAEYIFLEDKDKEYFIETIKKAGHHYEEQGHRGQVYTLDKKRV